MGRGGARDAGPILEDNEPVEAEFAFPLTDVDRHVLSLTDEQFKPHTWEELKQIIAENRLETLRRYPSALRRYLRWSAATKQEYGGVINYVRDVRLKWQPVISSTTTGPIFDYKSPIPFENPSDYKMLPNDWPYGLEKGITHLVVWLKNRLEVVPPLGDLSDSSRKLVQDFIQREFVEPTNALVGGTDNVLWFKNWVSLQSVPGIDHVHVLIRNLPQEIVDEKWTKGERQVQDMSVVERVESGHF